MLLNHPGKIPRPHVPRLASEWKPLFYPKKSGCYINDHCIIKGPDDYWHLIGITCPHNKPDPEHERWFAHGRGASLWGDELMTELNPVCDDANRAWAPCIVPHEGRYYMLYGPSPTKGAVSRDLNHWMGELPTLVGAPPEAALRDHMVIKLEESTWLLYTTGLDAGGNGVISVFVSHDVRTWRFVRYALRTCGKASSKCSWGATESPFVTFLGGWYYLSITYTDTCLDTENYHQSLVFRSLNPFDFGVYDADRPDETVIARLHAHAPEYLYCDKEKSWFITTCGWPCCSIPHEGGVSIAKLVWDEAT
jgi:beta-fructofuranosidase